MRGARMVGAGRVDDVLTTDAVSDAFGVDVVVEQREGRWTTRGGPDRDKPPVG
jgi:ABC-type hemin transport system ATPase subunit